MATSVNCLPHSIALPQTKDVRIVASQASIIEESARSDTIVIHSPGPIKTFLALETIRRVGTPALFIVPATTRVLHHANALKNGRDLDVQYVCGDMQFPGSFDVLVTTPTAFETAKSEYGFDFLQWRRIKFVIFDEVHQVVKHRPYRQLLHNMRRSDSQPRVLAFSQVWAGGMDREAYKKSIESVSNDLRVDRIRVALDDDGYQGAVNTNPRCPQLPSKVCATPQRLPENQQKPAPKLSTFLSRVENGAASPLSCTLTKCVLQMELLLSERDDRFAGLLLEGKGLKEWNVQSHVEKCMVIKKKQDLAQMYSQLDHWYEALRQLVISREEDVFSAVLYLRMFKCEAAHAKKIWSKPVQDFITRFWTLAPATFPRLDQLRDILLGKLSRSRRVRGHLRVKQKVTAHVLEYFISNDTQLAPYCSPACLYATTTNTTGTFCLSKKEFEMQLKKFASGSVNLLIATNVSIEGATLPSPEYVLDFSAIQPPASEVPSCHNDPMENSNAITTGKIKPMSQCNARSSGRLDSMDSLFSACTGSSHDAGTETSRLNAQMLERSAFHSLNFGHVTLRNVLYKLNLFCTNTNVVLQETTQNVTNLHFSTSMTYKSALREATGSACGPSKMASRRLAAVVLIDNLRIQLKKGKDKN